MRPPTTRLDGPIVLELAAHADERGFFVESFREEWLTERGITDHFVQDNHSRSTYGVIRGMHFQVEPMVAKLVRCARGAIVDVLVDVRPGSPAFGQWEAYELDDRSHRALYVPPGFAHGFCVVSDVADVLYKQSAYWRPGADRGFSPEDPDVGIAWPIPAGSRVFSQRDREAPRLADVVAPPGG